MSSDQCANNSDSSLKDAKDIQYLNDPDDSNPLLTPTAEPLGCGLQSKATNWLSDALAHELLDSDEEDAEDADEEDAEDADGFTKITRCKCTSCAASMLPVVLLLLLSHWPIPLRYFQMRTQKMMTMETGASRPSLVTIQMRMTCLGLSPCLMTRSQTMRY